MADVNDDGGGDEQEYDEIDQVWPYYFALSSEYDYHEGIEHNLRFVPEDLQQEVFQESLNDWIRRRVVDQETNDETIHWTEDSTDAVALDLARALAYIHSCEEELEGSRRGSSRNGRPNNHGNGSNDMVLLYLYMSRALLFLASQEQYDIAVRRKGSITLEKNHSDPPDWKSARDWSDFCLNSVVAANDPSIAPQALSQLAFYCVAALTGCLQGDRQDVNDMGEEEDCRLPHGLPHTLTRPAMAQAWLLQAQIRLLLLETKACRASDGKTVRPPCRLGPDASSEDRGTSQYSKEDSSLRWEVSIPGRRRKRFLSDSDSSSNLPTCDYLADYWWGFETEVAVEILEHLSNKVLADLERFRSLATRSQQQAIFWDDYADSLRGVQTRGAAALLTLSIGTKDRKYDRSLRDYQQLIEKYRTIFPGTQFDATEDFVCDLKRQPMVNGHPSVWAITCVLGAFETPNVTLLSVVDETSQRYPLILSESLLQGADGGEIYQPSVEDIYRVLLNAMAGVGEEKRAFAGPPRRPHAVLVSFRLRDVFEELEQRLLRVAVASFLETEESLRFSCTANNTDFDTGRELGAVEERILEGERVVIRGISVHDDLNGRVGRVIEWLEESSRWNVQLEEMAPDERALVVAVPAHHLGRCPQFFGVEDYLLAREQVRRQSASLEHIRATKNDGQIRKLLSTLQTQGEVLGKVCAICQESLSTTDKGRDLHSSSVVLPCGHAFDLDCLLPWIKYEKLECPCCRQNFGA